MSPRGISSPFGTIPRSYSYDIDAIFDIGMTDYDSTVIFMSLPIAQEFLNLGNVAGVIQIFVDNPEKSLIYKDKIDNELEDFEVFSRDWSQTNANLQEMLIVERNVMFLIFSLLLVITGINIVSGLIILVKDRSREISILRAMGMKKISIARLFIISGAKIGFFATFSGLIIGVLVSVYVENIRQFLMSIFDITLFNPEIYFLISMPSEIHIPEVITITVLSLFLSVIATIYPAIRSVARDPAEALRNE
jgi:lipoprotein-releasing system permease protein